MQDCVEVGLLFGADPVAADFAVRDRLEVHLVDQLIHRQLDREIGLVAEDQERDAVQGGLGHQLVQLFGGRRQGGSVGCVHDISGRSVSII